MTEQMTTPAPSPEPQSPREGETAKSPVEKSRSRKGCCLLGAAGVAVAICLAFVGLSYIRHRAMRVACAHNLRRISAASQAFADEHDGDYPANLEAMKSLDKKPWCPTTQYEEGWLSDWELCYRFESGLAKGMPDDSILAHDRPGDHSSVLWGTFRNVLFLDGHVEAWPASRDAEFQEKLVKQREAVKKWRAVGVNKK